MKKTAYIIAISLILATLIFSCGGGGGGAAVDDTSFTIGYNANGAESGAVPSSQKGSGKEVLSVSDNTGNLAKGGYLFDGWNTSADGSGTNYAPGALHNGKNITLYAKWALIFNYNVIDPGSPAPALNGIQKSPSLSTAIITGLTSRGRQISSLNIPESIDGYPVSRIGANAFSDCTNIAKITIPATITNIGDSAFSGCSNLVDMIMKSTTPPTVGADVFTGCTQLAVSVPQSAAATYNASPTWSTVPIIAPGSFSIIYNGNGSDGGAVPSRQVSTAGTPVQVYGNTGALTRAGCTFNGWNDKADGKGQDYVENDSYEGPDNLALYAQWTHPDYTVTFDGQDADTQASPITIIVKAPANTISSLPSTSPTKEGYYFAGWYNEPAGAGEPFVVGSQVIGDKIVYAKWSANDCTVIYSGNNASSGSVPDAQAAHFNQTITLRAKPDNLVRTGYRFGGWNTKTDGSGTNYLEGADYTVKGDVILYAKWLPLYTITYNSNDATGGAVPAAHEYAGINGERITLRSNTNNLVRTGYRFGGWNTKADGSGIDYATGASYTITGDSVLYAKWLKLYTITYNSNGATSGAAPETHEYAGIIDEEITLRSNTNNLARTGYRFGGWNTKVDGSGVDYATGASYTITGDSVLYAKWLKLYTITYNDNGATGGSGPGTQEYVGVMGEEITLRANTGNWVRADYFFGGWNTQSDGKGTAYAAGAEYTIIGDATLYAKWVTVSSTAGSRAGANIGDIVLSNRATINRYDYSLAAPSISAAGLSPVGVVAYEGNTYAGGTTPTGGGVGIKYMIGLDVFNGIQWCTTDAKGYSVTISEITRKEGGSQSGYYNTYNIIKEGGAESCTVDDYSSNLYPAFGCAIDYSVTGYTSGWYLPSYNEMTPLFNNRSKINDSMTKLVNAGVNAANFSGYVIWTSSIQAASACCYAIDVNYTSIVVPKDCEHSVRVIHALDD